LSSHRNAIHSLFASTGLSSALPELFLAADTDRYINVFSIGDQRLLGNLIADTAVERAEFLSTSVSSEQMSNDETLKVELLATINEDGLVEIFSQPFQHFLKDRSSTNSTSLKAQRKKMTKKADASLRVIRPDKAGSTVPVFNVSFQGPDLILARAEGGVNLEFERVRWADEDTGDLVLKGMKEIVRGKRSLGAAVMNGVKDVGKSHVDESHAVVGEGGVGDDVPMEDAPDVISLSSGVDSEDGSSSDVEGGESDFGEDANMPEPTLPTAKEVAMAASGEDEETTGEPSFGELLRAQTSDEPIDVVAALSNTQPRALAPSRSTALQIPSGVSLATILTQSLRTNDTNLLESCFHTTDTDIVRATIQRLDPNLCAILLQRLSERLSSRPGRYGHLLVWIQWICVAHGGYMAGNRDVQRKVTSLFRVLDQRCASLDSLLLLKGKLDMLDAQMGLRKRIQETGRGLRSSDDDEGIIYVEGQDESSSSDEEEHDAGKKRGKQATTLTFDVESSDNEDEDMPLTINGVAPESDDEDEESQEGEAELIDDEAEETDNDSDGESIGGESDDEDGDSEEGVDEFDEGMSEDDEGVDDEDIPVAVSTKKQKPTPRKAGASSSFVRG
jgi:U3 small nucleolar RNA-associated protein 5